MRKYIEPKIKAVELNPEQATLAVCANASWAGVWMNSTGDVCLAVGTAGGSFTNRCTSGNRVTAGFSGDVATTFSFDTESAGS